MATPEAIRTTPTKAKMLASSPVRGSLPFAAAEPEDDPEEPLCVPEEPAAAVADGDDPLLLLPVVLPLVPPDDAPWEPDDWPDPWFPPVWFGKGSW
jgi:hypothetical protein